jgi:hypothetical protein
MDSSDIGRRGLLLGGLASSWSLTSCTSSAPVVQAASPRRYADRPAIMAVGDSLYQGVRSLSFTSELALHSPPVQVARSLSLPMTVPDPAALVQNSDSWRGLAVWVAVRRCAATPACRAGSCG